jgi:hypothetical protein
LVSTSFAKGGAAFHGDFSLLWRLSSRYASFPPSRGVAEHCIDLSQHTIDKPHTVLAGLLKCTLLNAGVPVAAARLM